jgi:hypothetical protein
MEFVRVAKDTLFDSDANRGLQEKLQQRRRVNDDHADRVPHGSLQTLELGRR